MANMPTTGFDFGSFRYLCQAAPLPYCAALGMPDPKCYSRNMDLGGFLLFQPAVIIMDLIALVMALIMINHIRHKYTAIGRKEIVIFFYMYALCVLFDLLLMANFVPVGQDIYNYFVALQLASISTAFFILLLNGFAGFQWANIGTKMSLWTFRASGMVVFAIVFILSLFTFNGIAGMGKNTTLPLFIVLYIFNAAAFLVYFLLQIVLLVYGFPDRWPLGVIIFGALFFLIAQAIPIFASLFICRITTHYIDGIFFSNLFTLLAVMMVFKYWDSVTTGDLEFRQDELEQSPILQKDTLKGPPSSTSITAQSNAHVTLCP